MEFGRADYVSEHAPGVLARCDLEARERLADQGVDLADEGVWANWARLYPEERQRRIAQRLERCSNGGAASQHQAALVKALLITHFFKTISDEERDQWSAGGVGDRLEAAIQSLLDSPDNTVVLAKAGIEPGTLWNGVSSLRGLSKGGKEKHRRTELVRLVILSCQHATADRRQRRRRLHLTTPLLQRDSRPCWCGWRRAAWLPTRQWKRRAYPRRRSGTASPPCGALSGAAKRADARRVPGTNAIHERRRFGAPMSNMLARDH
jgi:hypothetical protein